MELVKTEGHVATFPHKGSVYQYEQATGKVYKYPSQSLTIIMVTFSESEQSTSEADLLEIEQSLTIVSPSEIRSHYLNFNGGLPDPYCFLAQNDTWLIVQEFLAVKYGTNTLESVYNTLTTNEALIPKTLVPFVIDPGGNYFCFSFSPNDIGTIYYYDHEHYDDPKRALLKIAGSLTKFLDDLQDEPDEF